MTAGLAHHWKFDERSGSTAVDSIGGVNGTIGADVTRIRGQVGRGGLHFPATDTASSSVSFTSGVGQFGTADFTVAFWFRTTSLKNNELVGNRTTPSHGNFAQIRTASGEVIFEVDQDGAGTNYAAAVTPHLYADNAWHRVFARRQGAQLSLFVDGVMYGPVVTGTGVANVNNSNDWIAGFSPGVEPCCDTDFLGDMDDLRIYNRALTDPEVIGCPDSDGDSDSDTDSDGCDGDGDEHGSDEDSDSDS